MKKLLFLSLILLFLQINLFAQQDTIYLNINLSYGDKGYLPVEVRCKSFDKHKHFTFPSALPGCYELIDFKYKNHIKKVKIHLNSGSIKKAKIKDKKIHYGKKPIDKISYNCLSKIKKYRNVSPEYTIFSDSLFLLNWNLITGYFENKDLPYKIEVVKPKDFNYTGSITRQQINDTLDILYAKDYYDLFHHPIMYGYFDTYQFEVNGHPISFTTNKPYTDYDDHQRYELCKPAIEHAYSISKHQPERYSFMNIVIGQKNSSFFYGSALEHPECSINCFGEKYEKDEPKCFPLILTHELCHALFTPLFIRSKRIEKFNFSNPKIDPHLWFYEGVVEYLAHKICLQANVIDTTEFLKAMHEKTFETLNNKSLAKISIGVYDKPQWLMGNFIKMVQFSEVYSRGCLVALLLDAKIIEESKEKISLIKVMQTLQKHQKRLGYFNSKDLFNLFSEYSGIDLSPFFETYVLGNKEINFNEISNILGYKLNIKEGCSTPFYALLGDMKFHYNKNKELDYFTISNRKLDIHKEKIVKINGEQINFANINELYHLKSPEINLTILKGNTEVEKTVKAQKIESKKKSYTSSKIVGEGIGPLFWGK